MRVGADFLHGFLGQIGVITQHVHAQGGRGAGYTGTDGSHADHTQSLALDLRPAEHGLAFFHGVPGFHTLALESLDPVGGLHDIARAQNHDAQDQFFDGVGVAAGGVEHDDAFPRARFHRDRVDARAHADDGPERLGSGSVVQGV